MKTIDMLLGFFTTNGMVVELTVSTLLFTWWLERRDMFWWRFLTGIAVMLVESMLWNAYIPQYFLTITVQNVIGYCNAGPSTYGRRCSTSSWLVPRSTLSTAARGCCR